MDRKKQIVIIGGGASGLTAAIFCARSGAAVTVVEHMDRVGKKILTTGNGRCNLTNLRMEPECYRCSQEGFPMKVIEGFGVQETLTFFERMGIEPRSRGGYIYPNSDQASSVLDALRWELTHLGVNVLLSCNVKDIVENASRYEVHTDQGTFTADALILAAGSKAAPSTGSDGSGYELAGKLGHHLIKPLPALVQLRCQGTMYKQVAGIRTQAKVRLMADGKVRAEDTGELQLTDYGLSGIPVFQISRYAARALDGRQRVTVLVDFLPLWKEDEAYGLLKKRVSMLADKTAEEMLNGLLSKKLAMALIKLAGIQPDKRAGNLSGKQLGALCGQLKSYEALVMSVNPFANAQVCCGGVDTREVDPATMESRIRKNLYLTGEILDVDGICGGYNLQFAWSSGALAGRNAGGTDRTDEASQPAAGNLASGLPSFGNLASGSPAFGTLASGTPAPLPATAIQQ